MSWVTIIWSMVAAGCLTLAAVNVLVWCKKRTAWANLLFSSTAVAAAATGFCELWMMRAATPEQFGTALRWLHVAAFVIIVSLVGFVLFYMRAGRPWLAWIVCVLRAFSLLLNFLTGQNLNYRVVTNLRHIPFLGESVAIGEGVPNPWMLLGQLSLLLFVVFVADAAITVWRRGDPRRMLVTGGSIVFFVLAGTAQSVLVLWQIVQWPYAPSLCFMTIVATMAYEMSWDTIRAARLTEELRESEARMSLAAEATGVGLWMWSLARDQVWGSERWLGLFGFTRDEAVGFEKVIQRIHPDDRESVERGVRCAVAERNDYMGDYRVVLPDSSQRWVVARGRVYCDVNGKPARMLGSAIDITQRKHMEAALKESLERFRQVVEFAGEFIWEVDANGLYTYASPSVEKILGYTPEELVAKKHFYDLFDPSVREGLKLAAFRVFADRQTFRAFHNLNVSKSGRNVHLETSGVPILDAAGNLAGYRGADADVTERRQAEQELSEQRNQLAHLSRVNMLGELAGSLAHELNQPLTAVLSNAQAAQRFLTHDPVDLSEVRDILADIVAEDKRAGEVIRRLRLLLKKGEVQIQPLHMNEVVQEVLMLVRSDLVNQNFAAGTELAPHLPVLYGDRVQLQQVLLNLVKNGCDAMAGAARNNRQLTIRTSLAEHGSVHISVADRGAGIDPEKLEQVFEPFYTTKPHGLGLGLAVCRTIITAHGGKLWATNNPGCGATFHFSLPVIERGSKSRRVNGKQ